MKWREFTPCPAHAPGGQQCEGELGHRPAAEGDHWATERTPRGRILGPVFWSDTQVRGA